MSSLSTKYGILGLNMTCTPKRNEQSKRVIGFTVDTSEIPVLGLFDDQLEELAVVLLKNRGYNVSGGRFSDC
jgi:hypothetical protein